MPRRPAPSALQLSEPVSKSIPRSKQKYILPAFPSECAVSFAHRRPRQLVTAKSLPSLGRYYEADAEQMARLPYDLRLR